MTATLQNTQALADHFGKLYNIHGDRPEALQEYPDVHGNRLAVISEWLTQQASVGDRLLDFGCGTGNLAEAIADLKCEYIGVDIVDQFLNQAKSKFPESRFCKFDELGDRETFDFFVANAVFNINTGSNTEYWQKILRWAWERTEKAIAINFISTYVEYTNPDMYYVSPEEAIDFIKGSFGIATRFALRNDYLLRDGVDLPYEFTVFIYK